MPSIHAVVRGAGCLMACLVLALSARPTAHADVEPRGALDKAAALARDNPSAWHAMGLMEMRRAAGAAPATQPAVLNGTDPHAADLQRLVCWRLLPVAEPRVAEFRQQAERLRSLAPSDPWFTVFDLYACWRGGNRTE